MIGVWDASDGRFLREIGPTAGEHLKSMAVTPDGRRHPLGRAPVVRGARCGGTTWTARARRDRRRGRCRPLQAARADAADRESDRDPALGHRDRRAHPGPRRSGGDRLRLRGPLARRPEDGDRQLPRASHAGRFDARAGVDDRPARLVGPAGRVLVRWEARRHAEQNTVAIFEVATGRRLHHDASTPVGRVGAVAWSPSGDRIVTGHADGFVRVWDAATGKLIWHKLLAPVVSRSGWHAAAGLRGLLARRQAASSRPAAGTIRSKSGKGIVVVYEAASGRRCARSLEEGSAGRRRHPTAGWSSSHLDELGDTHFVGIEVGTGRTRWTTPPVNKPGTLRPAGRACSSRRTRPGSKRP